MRAIPTIEQVLQVPAVRDVTVPPEYLDVNDHMNNARYLDVATTGLWYRMKKLGMGSDYVQRRRLTTFTAEHHIVYLAELRLGDRLSVHPRLLARSAKVLHSMTFVVDRTHDRVAATCEATEIHIDMDTRRPKPFPDDIATALDVEIATSDGLCWAAPVSGLIGIRSH